MDTTGCCRGSAHAPLVPAVQSLPGRPAGGSGAAWQFRDRTIAGVGWSALGQCASVLLGLLFTVILARLLSPKEFGLVGMITVITGFVTLFADLGLSQAVIQKRDIAPRHLNAVFWANVAMGVGLTLAAAAAAPFIASFYREPPLLPMIMALSVNFTVGSLGAVQTALLQKEMNFRRLAGIQACSLSVAGAVSVALALSGWKAWSLVAQSLVLTGVSVALTWRFAEWRPAFSLSLAALRELFGFSSRLLGFNALNYWVRNLDNLLVGKFLGTAALGIYSRAYALMLLPLSHITVVLTRVMFPALSAIQQDREQVKRIYLRSLGVISLITFPLMAGLFVTADHFVLALFGPAWAGVIPVLRILCLVGMDQSVGSTVGWIYQSQGRTDVLFKWGIAAGAVVILSFVIGLRWGVTGVAWGYFVSNTVILSYPSRYISGRLINLRVREIARALAPVFACAAAMAVIVRLFGLLLPAAWPHAASLAVESACGAAVYALLVLSFRLAPYEDLAGMLDRYVSPLRGRPAAANVRRAVLHYKHGTYLPVTENWIYGQIKFLRRYTPIVYCHGTENRDAYPVECIMSLPLEHNGRPWICFNKAFNRVFHFYPSFAMSMLKDRPGLIHAHFGPAGFASLRLKRLFRLPLITTFYGFDISKLVVTEPHWRARYRQLFREGECFTVEGNHMKERLVELGCPAQKVLVHRLGIDLSGIPFRPRTGGGGVVRILVAGRFCEKKGIPYAVEAVGRLQAKLPGLKILLTVIGDAREKDEEKREKSRILHLVRAHRMGDRTRFTGFQPSDVFRRELYRHDIFLAPSVTASDGDSEGGVPVALIEASASGMPVLSTLHADIPEAVVNAASGFLVPERDADALLDRLEALVAHPGGWGGMGSAGRTHIEERYDCLKQARELEQIYEKFFS